MVTEYIYIKIIMTERSVVEANDLARAFQAGCQE